MAELHRFYYPGVLITGSTVTLESETAKHIWQVLRMDEGDHIALTDGKGTIAEGEIQFAERHKCNVRITEAHMEYEQGNLLHLCVAFTKNNSRNEWLLEKAAELGVSSIIPIVSERFQRIHVRFDRWDKILQSAILQSQRSYLPELHQLTPLQEVLTRYKDVKYKLIAHCEPDKQKKHLPEVLKPGEDAIVLIGPEGDFSPEEINLCTAHGFKPVSLGAHRLRTETAAITVAAHFNLIAK